MLCALMVLPAAAATTELTVARYNADGSVAAEETVGYEWLEANLPVQGDAKTHYYHQGPVFEEGWEMVHPGEPYNYWDPAETVNYQTKDYGAVKGTAVRDLCDLVGGMSDGDTVKIIASDGFYKYFPYDAVYRPPPRMGTAVVTWYRPDRGYVPNYFDGMRLVFFADTSTNPDGWHVFGNYDMKETLSEAYWHYYWANPSQKYPTTTGLSVQYISRIEIYPGSSGAGPSAGGSGGDDSFLWKPETGTLNITSLPDGATVWLDGEQTEVITNASMADLPVGEYGVTVVRDDYRSPAEVWVTVPAGGTGLCHFDLEELYAPLIVTTWPKDARFSLDGELIMRPAGTTLEAVTVGTHSVTVTADGYRPETRIFRVEEGGETVLSVALSPLIDPATGNTTTDAGRSFGPGPAGENGSVPSLSLIDAAGGLLPKEGPIKAFSPAGRLYVCLSHGANSTSGEAEGPRFEVQSNGTVLLPDRVWGGMVAGQAGDTVAVTAVYDAPAGIVTVTGTGGADEVASLQALALLTPGENPQTGWYATFEGVVPASGVMGEITLPPAAYAGNGNISLQALLTTEPDMPLPGFALGGVPLEPLNVTGTSEAVLVQFAPVPVPAKGAVFSAEGDGNALLRLIVVTGDAAGAGGAATMAASPEKIPAESGNDRGWLSAFIAWLAKLFGYVGTSEGTISSPVTAVATPVPSQAATPAPSQEVPVAEGEGEPAAPDAGADATPVTISPQGLYITSIPGGAAITLDGKATGDTTPALYSGLKEGLHRVSVKQSATGRTATSAVWVHEGILVPVSFTLVADPLASEVTIRSADGEPVAFTLNGAYPLYETPKELTLTTATSWVATRSGDAFISTRVPFSPRDGEVLLPAPGTVASTCSVAVRSDPEGAALLVDGYVTDLRTPALVRNLSAGVHTVTVNMAGHLPESREIRLVDKPEAVDESVSITLAPYASGDLCLISDPPGAKVFLYGRYIGCRTPCTVSGMAIGTYAVGFTLEDESKVVDVTVIPDDVAEGTCIFHDLAGNDRSGQIEMTEDFQ